MTGSALIMWTALAALASSPPAAAQTGSTKKRALDPNERVCEEIVYTGSRLGVKRVCATRAEWAERRRLDKEAIDRAQMSPNGPCNTINTHSGAAAC